MGIVSMFCSSPSNRITFERTIHKGELALLGTSKQFDNYAIMFDSQQLLDQHCCPKTHNGNYAVYIEMHYYNDSQKLYNNNGVPIHIVRLRVLVGNLEKYNNVPEGTYKHLLNPGTVWTFIYQTKESGQPESDMAYYKIVV